MQTELVVTQVSLAVLSNEPILADLQQLRWLPAIQERERIKGSIATFPNALLKIDFESGLGLHCEEKRALVTHDAHDTTLTETIAATIGLMSLILESLPEARFHALGRNVVGMFPMRDARSVLLKYYAPPAERIPEGVQLGLVNGRLSLARENDVMNLTYDMGAVRQRKGNQIIREFEGLKLDANCHIDFEDADAAAVAERMKDLEVCVDDVESYANQLFEEPDEQE